MILSLEKEQEKCGLKETILGMMDPKCGVCGNTFLYNKFTPELKNDDYQHYATVMTCGHFVCD